MFNIVAISGSARTASCNTGLLRYAIETAKKNAPNLNIELLEGNGQWPLFDADLLSEDGSNVPESIKLAIKKVKDADAVLLCTPEYNFSMSPVATNTIAWLSKPGIMDKTQDYVPLQGKPLGILSAGGGLGGLRAQYHARSGFAVFLNMPTMAQPEVGIRIFSPGIFDLSTGDLLSEKEKSKIDNYMTEYQNWVSKFVTK